MFDPLLAEPRSFISVVFTQCSGRKADQYVIPGGDRCHSLSHCIQTASGVHPASSAIDNVSCISGVTQSGLALNHSPISWSQELRTTGAIPPLQVTHGQVLQGAAERTPRFGKVIASGGEGVQ